MVVMFVRNLSKKKFCKFLIEKQFLFVVMTAIINITAYHPTCKELAQMNQNELLPCPFCDSQPLGLYPPNLYNKPLIFCKDYGHYLVVMDESMEKAITAWNTRK